MDLPKLAKDIMVTKLVTLSPDKDVFKAVGLLLKMVFPERLLLTTSTTLSASSLRNAA